MYKYLNLTNLYDWHQQCFENLPLSQIWRYERNYLLLWQSDNLWSSEFSLQGLLVLQKIRKYSLSITCTFETNKKNTHLCLQAFSFPFTNVQTSVEPANSTGRILRRLCSLEVKIGPNCLGRSRNPPTEPSERGASLMNRHVSIRTILAFQSPSNHLSPLVSFRSLPLPTILALWQWLKNT